MYFQDRSFVMANLFSGCLISLNTLDMDLLYVITPGIVENSGRNSGAITDAPA
jgi:hypothetical protein